MDPRASEWVSRLRLEPHPEGGFFREIFRSETTVEVRGAVRSALTVIHFLLPGGDCSRWHGVTSDEQWTFLEGDPLELFVVEPESDRLQTIRLGPLAAELAPTAVVPGGSWQAARSRGGFSLVTCTVGPGFDYADFHHVIDDLSSFEIVSGKLVSCLVRGS